MTSNFEPSPHQSRPWFLNPVFVFYSTWLSVWFLYTLRLSNLLLFSNSSVASVELPILGAFLPFYFLTKFLPNHLFIRPRTVNEEDTLSVLDRRLTFWFRFWLVLTAVEVVYSGGIPIVWSLIHSSKTYFDFGIPTLHGLLNGLLLAISISRFAIGIKFRSKRNLLFPLFTLVWAFIVVTRQEIMVLVLECAFIFLMYRELKLKRVLHLGLFAILAVIIFGVAGDLRSGADSFRELAAPSDNFPTWLPSGFLWVYMYATTPLNNAINTYIHVTPLGDFTLPNTLSSLIPTAVRNLFSIHGDVSSFTGDLITQAFNVSTAYVGPMQDLGIWGIMGFSGFASTVTGIFWRRTGMRDNLVFAVLLENLTLTIFLDHFLFLPIVSQIFWLYIFFRGLGGDVEGDSQLLDSANNPVNETLTVSA